MIKINEQMAAISRATEEYRRAKPGTPHHRDAYKHLRRLKAELREARGWLNDSERVFKAN